MELFPFEVPAEDVLDEPGRYVNIIFACLESEFLVMPKGPGFVEYPVFEAGYEKLKKTTGDFSEFDLKRVWNLVAATPISFVVLRTMLGFTPPELAYVASQTTGTKVSQGFLRNLDRKIRMSPMAQIHFSKVARARVTAVVRTACDLLSKNIPEVEDGQLHRLDKADTRHGLKNIQRLAEIGAPYAMLLYERFLGRPFAGHRDSVSELIGNSLESAIEDVLTNAGVSFRKTKRAEKIEGFDQTPDFIIPSEYNPEVVIEAKITEDDGTARDKVTRIQHLAALSTAGRPKNDPKYQVVACIAGRGFGVRRADMVKLLTATRGKVFTLRTLDRMVANTRLQEFRTK